MANSNAPFGLRPVRRLDGAAANYQAQAFQIAYGNSNSIGTGDLVKLLTTGYIDVAGAADTPCLGVFVGCEYYDHIQKKKVFMPAWLAPTLLSTTVVTAYVIVDTQMIFEVQSSAANVTVASIGSTAKITGNGNPNTSSGMSILALDSGTLADTTATYPIMVVGLSNKVGNDNASTFNTVEVVLNATNFKAGVTGLA